MSGIQDAWNLILREVFTANPTEKGNRKVFFEQSQNIMLVSKIWLETLQKHMGFITMHHPDKIDDLVTQNDPQGRRIRSFLRFCGFELVALSCSNVSLNVLQAIKELAHTLISLKVHINPNSNITNIFKGLACIHSLQSLEINLLYTSIITFKDHERIEMPFYRNKPTSDDLSEICKLTNLRSFSCNMIQINAQGHLLKLTNLSNLERLDLGMSLHKSICLKDDLLHLTSSLTKLKSFSIFLPEIHPTLGSEFYKTIVKLKIFKGNYNFFCKEMCYLLSKNITREFRVIWVPGSVIKHGNYFLDVPKQYLLTRTPPEGSLTKSETKGP